MDPKEDDVQGRLFNQISSINIYSGLLASGLIGYVLQPTEIEEDFVNEATGLQQRTLVEMQMFVSQVNLLVSMIVFTFTTFSMYQLQYESSRTVVWAAAHSKGLLDWLTIAAVQVFLVALQICLAALTHMRPWIAKMASITCVVVFLALHIWFQNILFDLFPMVLDSVRHCAPVVMWKQFRYGRGHLERIGKVMAEEAHNSAELDYQNEAQDLDASSADADEPNEDIDEEPLRVFIQQVFPKYSAIRIQCLVSALLGQGMTVDVLRKTAKLDVGAFFKFPMEGTTFGERVLLGEAAWNDCEERMLCAEI